MSWVKLDDRFPDHPKLLGLKSHYDAGLALHIRAMCYCATNLTDGYIPAHFPSNHELARKLVDAGLWDECDGGYMVHDYLEYNPSRDDVISQRTARSEAGKAGAEARWGSRADSKPHGKCHSKSHGTMLGKTDAPLPLNPLQPQVFESQTDSKTSPCRDSIHEQAMGYFCDKVGRDASESEQQSLMVLSKKYPAGVLCTAIGQAALQGDPTNFALITTIAKGESR